AKASYYPYKTATLDVTVSEPAEAEYVTVTFNGNITDAPAPITVLKGSVLKISDYMNGTSPLAGKRFNGWLLDGELVNEDITVESDITLTALVNDDYNFAVDANHSHWKYNVGSTSKVGDTIYCTYNHASNTDVYMTNESLSVSAAKCSAIEYYIDVNYKVGGEAKTLAVGDSFEGLFFGRTGEGAHWQRQITATVGSVTEDGKYAVVTFNMAKSAYWNGNIEYLRFDFLGNAAYEFAVRYIRFVGDSDATTIYASAKEGQNVGLGSGNWTLIDNGNTEATLSGNLITTKGYSGVVKLNDCLNEVTLYLVGGNKWKPGLNILTGTTDVIDITHENGKYVVGENADIRDVANETSAATNAVAQYETNYGNHWFPVEEISFDRNILIRFDFSGASNSTRVVVNGGNEGKFYYDFGSLNNHGSWKTYKYDGLASTNATSNFSSVTKLGVVLCWNDYVEAYLDNYLFIPFYKVTYTGIGDEYFLYDENGNIATSYTIDTAKSVSEEGKTFLGWSTDKYTTEPMTEVTLCNEDVVLYPVWQIDDAVEYDLAVSGEDSIVLSAEEKTYTYTAQFSAEVPDKSVEWSVDNKSVATIDENGVLTPVSAGTVKVC
ncbi:MAG: InlB B-repeat-containing protein, partial [Clostridia bacterium]|nr:InlB B-repeat-containing protein [Clostridia bacterium]